MVMGCELFITLPLSYQNMGWGSGILSIIAFTEKKILNACPLFTHQYSAPPDQRNLFIGGLLTAHMVVCSNRFQLTN